MIETIVRMKLVLADWMREVFSRAGQTVIAAGVLFVSSIAVFALVYDFLQRFHEVNMIVYKGKVITGGVVPLPAFQLSEPLRKRLEIRVKNDLRLREFAGNSTNASWQSFSQNRLLDTQSVGWNEHDWTEFHDMNVLGLSPSKMVEKTFRRYSELKFRIVKCYDNSFDDRFPVQVLRAYSRIVPAEEVWRRVATNRLTLEETKLLQALKVAAPQIRQTVLEGTEGQLLFLSDRLVGLASDVAKQAEDKPRLKDVFYGEVLSTLASETQIEFLFDSLPLRPEFMDFVYMSTLLATSNVPSELVPVTNDVRIAVWFQLMFSYFSLALLVAALVKWLGLG